MIPQTVVCNIDKRSSYETALAYQEAGALARFVTGVFQTEATARWAARIPVVGRRIARRSDDRLDYTRVLSMGGLDVIGQGVDTLLGERFPFSPLQIRNAIFDRRAASCLDGAAVVHGFETIAARTFSSAKKRGMRTILDAQIVHPATWLRIFEEEIAPLLPSGEARAKKRHLDNTRQQKNDEIALADKIFAPSEWVAKSYRDNANAADRLALAPFGNRIREGDPIRPGGKPRFLCLTSGLGFRKGTHVLLEAFAPLRHEAELWLAGRVLPELAPFLAAHGQSVRLFGNVGPAKAQELFDQCHVFVFPSLCEGMSFAVLEAMGQGLPVVVTERCGSPVENGVEGLVVPASERALLAEALVSLRAPGLRAAMGERAKNQARRYTWDSYRQAVRDAADSPTKASMPARGLGGP